MNRSILALFVSANIGLISTAQAEWRVGANIGSSDLEVETTCQGLFCDLDDSDTSYGINLSYNFTKNWGVEAGYIDFGSATLSGVPIVPAVDARVEAEADISSAYLAGTATYYFSNQFSVTGRAGIGFVDADLEARIIGSIDVIGPRTVSDSGSDEEFYAGASLDYHFNDRFTAGVRYDYVDVADTSAVSLGVQYRFGK